jgi:hypothetical protein
MSQFINMQIAVKVGNDLHRRHLRADTRVMFEAHGSFQPMEMVQIFAYLRRNDW